MTITRIRKRPTLERVHATTGTLFYDSGLHATGVDLIAAEANISKATPYTYFETIDDLVAAYLRRRSQQWQAHVAEVLENKSGSARGRILVVHDLLDEWFSTLRYCICPFINSDAECGTDTETVAHRVNLEHRVWVGARTVQRLARGERDLGP